MSNKEKAELPAFQQRILKHNRSPKQIFEFSRQNYLHMGIFLHTMLFNSDLVVIGKAGEGFKESKTLTVLQQIAI